MQRPDRLELDPAVEGQLVLDTFQVYSSVPLPNAHSCLLRFSQGKFDVKDLVGSVSEKLITQSKVSSGRACDPSKSPPSCDAFPLSLRPETFHPYIRSSR